MLWLDCVFRGFLVGFLVSGRWCLEVRFWEAVGFRRGRERGFTMGRAFLEEETVGVMFVLLREDTARGGYL